MILSHAPSVRLQLDSESLRATAQRALDAAGLPIDDTTAGEGSVTVISGPQARADARAYAPDERPVVVVADRVTRRSVADLLDLGADGVVEVQQIEATLAATVLAVAAGQVVVPSTARNAVRRPILSSREKQILGMVVMGLTNAEIATRLHLAQSTVKSHMTTLLSKLGVSSRKEAADLVLDPSAGLGTGILAITPEQSGDIQ